MTSATNACGTEIGYRRHRADKIRPCLECCAAHAVEVGGRRLYNAAREGREPAEILDQAERWALVRELHAAGWDDGRIAVHTRMSTYTTVRIRDGLGLVCHSDAQPAPVRRSA